MRYASIFVLSIVLLSGCAKSDEPWFKFGPWADHEAVDKKAREDFLKRPVIEEFRVEGIELDCEQTICVDISDDAIEVLRGFKNEFAARHDRINSIVLTKEDYPSFDFRSVGVYLPAKLSVALLTEFFGLWNTIRKFEDQLGFAVEFPNSRYVNSSILPLLQILKDNRKALSAEKSRLDVLVVSSVYNSFHPKLRLMYLKIDDLRASFDSTWAHMQIFFEAQDAFGSIRFEFDKDDLKARAALQTMLDTRMLFEDVMPKLQGRLVRLFKMDFYGYADHRGFLSDLGVSTSHGLPYLLQVFLDQAAMVRLEKAIGHRIVHSNSMIELEDHSVCLDKLSALEDELRAKVPQLEVLEVGHGILAPSLPSAFAAKRLYINCGESVETIRAAVLAIP